MDRANPIGTLSDSKKRLESYRQLYHAVNEVPLSTEEAEGLLSLLEKETDEFCRIEIWRNLLSVPAQDKIKEKALSILKNTKDYERYYAILYVLRHYPEMFDILWKDYSQDFDPNVRYRLADSLLDKNEDKALSMMIDILPEAGKIIGNHEVCDAIELTIFESGKEKYIKQLKELRGN